MNILSLFANIGIAEACLSQIGFHVSVANEKEKKRADIYRSIYTETEMICGDITDEPTYEHIIKSSKEKKVEIVMATPPCQGMSTAGKLYENDIRNILFHHAVQVVLDLEPKYFLLENVPAFMTTYVQFKDQKLLIPDVIKNALGDKYYLQFNVVNAKKYGVPQTRERMILLGTRLDINHKWTMPTACNDEVNMMDAIGHLPILDPFVKDISEEEFKRLFPKYEERRKAALKISPWHIPTSHVYRNVYVMQHTPTGFSAWKNEVEYKPKKKNGEYVRGFGNTYKRQNWDRPAYTIAMDNVEISSQNNVHPGRYLGKDELGADIYSDPRTLTIYELMKLMSIPEDWPIPLTTDKVLLRRLIGEGVPSLLVKKIFEQIKRNTNE